MSRAIATGWLLLTWVLVTPVGLSAEEPQEGHFGEVVQVRLVNVEVWVTDDRGAHIQGLGPEDFLVLEDGEPVEISYFAEIRRNRLLLEGSDPAASPAGEGAGEEPRARGAAERQPNHLVVYLDKLHLAPGSLKRIVRDLRELLWDLRVPPERMLIVSQGRELQTELAFGSTRREAEAALDRLERSGAGKDSGAVEKRLVIRNLQQLWQTAEQFAASSPLGGPSGDRVCDYFMPRALKDIENYIVESRQRLTVTLDHLSSVAAFLSGVRGVKTMLYVSDSLERTPGADLIAFANDLCPQWYDSRLLPLGEELSRDFDRLTRHANANRVTIYALQTSGLEGNFSMGADQGFLELRGTRSFDGLMRTTERDGMTVLAAETGGRAIFNRNEFDRELAAVADEMENYYSLAYDPRHGGDRGDHEIEVRLVGHDFRVRHREGYRDKDPDVRMAERLQGALFLGLVDNPMGVRLGAGSVERDGEKHLIVPLHVIVPAESVVFLPGEEGEVAQLSLQFRTENTRRRGGVFEAQTFRVGKPPGGQEFISLLVRLRLREGVHVVAVGVRDDTTREASFVSTTLELHRSAETLPGG
ncbi:MAG: VWA domain-containing protein [Thermoanaerobaculia bacterium]|nr:VWA domain-containing protein [Thermoanaerobaculia bacterium]